MVLIGLVTDLKCWSVHTYLRECKMLFLERSVRRVVDNNTRLQFILVGDSRKDDALAAEAHKIILCHYHDEDKNNYHVGGENIENESGPPALVSPPPAAEAAGTPSIFDFNHLKETVESLDFEASRRLKRGRSGEIHVHDKINSSESVKSQVFL